MIKYSHLSVRTYESNVVTIFMILVLLLSIERRHYDTHLFFPSFWSIKSLYLWFLILCFYELCGCVCFLCSLFSPFYFNFCFFSCCMLFLLLLQRSEKENVELIGCRYGKDFGQVDRGKTMMRIYYIRKLQLKLKTEQQCLLLILHVM